MCMRGVDGSGRSRNCKDHFPTIKESVVSFFPLGIHAAEFVCFFHLFSLLLLPCLFSTIVLSGISQTFSWCLMGIWVG